MRRTTSRCDASARGNDLRSTPRGSDRWEWEIMRLDVLWACFGTARPRVRPRPCAGCGAMLPRAEDLEGRTLLSVGLDPTYGFGGVAEVNQPATSATTSFSQNDRLDRLAERPGGAGRDPDDDNRRRGRDEHHRLERLAAHHVRHARYVLRLEWFPDDPLDHRWRDIQCQHELRSTDRGPVERVDRRRGGRHS